MRARILALALAGLALSPASHAESITLSMGYLAPPYRVDQAFRTVEIGDPAIVDVRALSDHAVVFKTKKPGATNVVFYDEAGNVLHMVNIVVGKVGTDTIEIVRSSERRGMVSDIYRCSAGGCEYISNDAHLHFLDETRNEPARNNGALGAPNPDAQTSPASASSPSIVVPQDR